MSASTESMIIQHLTVAGDGTGAFGFTGDYSVTPAYPLIVPGAGEIYELHKMVIYLEDNGNFDADVFAANGVLTNGIDVQLVSGTTVLGTMTGGDPVQTNGGLMHYASDWSRLAAQGAGNTSFKAGWSFVETFGQPFRIRGKNLEGVRVKLNDDFSGLEHMEFLMYGHRIIDPSRRLTF